MAEETSLQDDFDPIKLYESLSARTVGPPRKLKVKEQARMFEEAAQARVTSPTSATSLHKKTDEDTYGLKIFGCTAPGIADRPLSAATRLGLFDEDDCKERPESARGPHNVLSTTDEYGDVMEVSDTFQKLKIARNIVPKGAFDGAGDGPCSMPAFMTPEERVASATNGITIKSLTSNAIVVVPETHRSSQASRNGRPPTGRSSAEEIQIHPTSVNKSKIQARRKRVKKVEHSDVVPAASAGPSRSFHRSVPDETTKEQEGPSNKTEVVAPHHEFDDASDVGADIVQDYDCCSGPSTARTTVSVMFDEFELLRPDTCSSEILADGALVSEEERQLQRLMKALEIHDDENWYDTVNEENDHSNKNNVRQLVKLFYGRYPKDSVQGPMYTYKLRLGGLHNRLEDFVLLPVAPGFVLRTRVTRIKKGVSGRFHPVYYMHLEREGPGDRKCLLLVAKKVNNFRGSCYIISTDPAELNLKSEYCVGKVTSNFIGTEFTLHSGRSICANVPLDKGALLALPNVERFKEELAAVIYDPNVLGFKGPRKIKMVLPRMKNLLERETVIPRIAEETLLKQYECAETENIMCLRNKDPMWSRESHSYILNFGGRVSTASVKNFQIISLDNEDQILLQFGRASDHTFSLDFHFPFCPLQAFAIALSSFDSKLACE